MLTNMSLLAIQSALLLAGVSVSRPPGIVHAIRGFASLLQLLHRAARVKIPLDHRMITAVYLCAQHTVHWLG